MKKLLNFKKIPNKGGFINLFLPIFVMIVITGLIGSFLKPMFAVAFGIVIAIIILLSVVKYSSFIKKSNEIEVVDAPVVHSIVKSVCEYFDIEEPVIRSFESDYEEVFAVGLKSTYNLMISELAMENLAEDELEFLIIQELVNINRGRMIPLTLFAPTGTTFGIGHLFTKWISNIELMNDKVVLIVTKNIEQCIRTIITVNDFNEESEMSIKEIVNIFLNARKSQLRNVTNALDLDEYIIDRVVEILKFSRSREYKKLSDSTPILTIEYSINNTGIESDKIKINELNSFDSTEKHSEKKYEEEYEHYEKEKVNLKENKENNDKYYEEIMGGNKFKYENEEIEIDILKEAEEDFREVTSKYAPQSLDYEERLALKEVAASSYDDEDDKKQKTSVFTDKYNIRRDDDDDFEYEEESGDEIKKKIILCIIAVLILLAAGFAVKKFIIDKNPKAPVTDGQKDEGDNTDANDNEGGKGTDTETEDKEQLEVFRTLMEAFEKKWIEHVNTGSNDYLTFLISDGELYTDLTGYNIKGKTQELLLLEVKEYKMITDTKADIYFHEKIQEIHNGEKRIWDYNLIYTAVKVGDEWKLESGRDNGTGNQDSSVNNYPDSTFKTSLSYKYSDVRTSSRLSGEIAQEIENALRGFNNGWIDYVNTNDKNMFNYLLKDSDAYNKAIRFKENTNNAGIKQRFDIMEIKDVRKGDNAYYVWVHELIHQTKGAEVKNMTYHWIYVIKKSGNEYLVSEYFKDPAFN
ncbi:TcaA NTF2-like domain-containing protein [Oceanirhabdus sp. W0125-5]|uniref:TcaA NTF2-like domain-containing protein n=1 Tax=Oceanirhabdus sp. W0125-5 TaxID=2999116 RepID=UPI0022F2A990|nr:hypothetical protein [Oceanirhabdus sp. W0125-5]WBW95796.1 hypothetical protein OW730_19190 [Oceanirhabdus sp. W0125-5]